MQLPDLLRIMREGRGQWLGRTVSGGRVVYVDKLARDHLRATLHEAGNQFTRESKFSTTAADRHVNATAWLDAEVLASLDGPLGGAALLLVDRGARNLGELDLDALATKFALAAGVIG